MAADDYHTRRAEEADADRELVQQIAHQLRTDPEYQAYFAGYDPASVDLFIRYYAINKPHWRRHGPDHLKWRIRAASEFRTEAYERLWEIQQKKLFDAQDRWRAGLLELPGVTIGLQFSVHFEYVIHLLDWLPPITEADVELYAEYLLSDACRDVGYGPGTRHMWCWQDYPELRETALAPDPTALRDPRPYPDWYRYYDEHTGTWPFQHPDHRGEREEFYQQLARAEESRHAPPTEPYVPDPRPRWEAERTRDLFAEFTERFDPAPTETLALRAAYKRGTDYRLNSELADALELNAELLLEAQERLPLEADAPDWRQAIVDLGNQLRKQLLAVALREVYEDEYLLRRQTGLALAPPDPDRTVREQEPQWLDEVRQEILRGRELNGEPRDFTY